MQYIKRSDQKQERLGMGYTGMVLTKTTVGIYNGDHVIYIMLWYAEGEGLWAHG